MKAKNIKEILIEEAKNIEVSNEVIYKLIENKDFMEEVEEYCELLLKCVNNDELSDELAKELIDRKNRIAKLYKKEKEKVSCVQK